MAVASIDQVLFVSSPVFRVRETRIRVFYQADEELPVNPAALLGPANLVKPLRAQELRARQVLIMRVSDALRANLDSQSTHPVNLTHNDEVNSITSSFRSILLGPRWMRMGRSISQSIIESHGARLAKPNLVASVACQFSIPARDLV